MGDGFNDAVKDGASGGECERLVVEVVHDSEGSPGLEGGGDALDDEIGLGDKAHEPACVGAVKGVWGEVEFLCVCLEDLDVVDAFDVSELVEEGEEFGGGVGSDDGALGADDGGEFKAGEAWAAAEIEDALTRSEAGPLPVRGRGRGPEDVLETEAIELDVAGSEEVLVLECFSHVAIWYVETPMWGVRVNPHYVCF